MNPMAARESQGLKRHPIVRGERRVAVVSTFGNPCNPTLLLFNGWGAGPGTYDSIGHRLAVEYDIYVVEFSTPGSVGTDFPDGKEPEFASYTPYIDAGIDAARKDGILLDDSFHLAGHSFGGGTATQYAKDHPERVKTLNLLNSVGGGPMLAFDLRFLYFPFDMIAQTRAMWRSAVSDVAGNVSHPMGLRHQAATARRDRLEPVLDALGQRKIPGISFSSPNDGLVSRATYESQARRLGRRNICVPGGHSWFMTERGTKLLASAIAYEIDSFERSSAVRAATDITSPADLGLGRILETTVEVPRIGQLVH
jgi:pimeloyl-ACP methyl ester carboxylesterase